MNRNLAILFFLVGLSISILAFPEGIVAVFVGVVFASLALWIINKLNDENEFLSKIFLVALLVRLIFGSFVYFSDLTGFFASDAFTYDFLGNRLLEIWYGQSPADDFWGVRATATTGSGWGMYRIVAALYFFTGKNLLAAQFFSCVIGAATAPGIYICAEKIFHNKRVSQTVAWLVALCPSLIIWSSQLLKDGYLVFLLVVVMICVLHLHEKFSYISIIVLTLSLFGILSLRFYIFYMLVVAVVGSFIIGLKPTPRSVFSKLLIFILVGITLTYLGVLRNAGTELEEFASLERIQQSRSDLAERAESGFGQDLDVSTGEGALTALPIGFSYLMFAPFPWDMTNLRQLLTLPEMILWWASMPFLIMGLWYTIKYRLRTSIGILLFTLMLTFAYSIFQGNVGTAYRQRAQIQVFLFMFIAVGWSILKEQREDRKLLQRAGRQNLGRRLQAKA